MITAFFLLQAVLGPRFYMPRGDALLHAARKSVISTAVYSAERHLGVPKGLAAVTAVVAPWALGAGLEALKGHRQSVGDKIGDLAWHGLVVWPLASKRAWLGAVSVGVIFLTRSSASPGW